MNNISENKPLKNINKSSNTSENLLSNKSIAIDGLYQQFFENNAAVMLLIDATNGNILLANRAAADFYGYTQDEFSTMNVSAIHTLSPEKINIKLNEARLKNQNRFFFKHRTASGNIKDVDVLQSKIILDDRELFSVIIQDISISKKTAENFDEITEIDQQEELCGWELNLGDMNINLSESFNAMLGNEPINSSIHLTHYMSQYVYHEDSEDLMKKLEYGLQHIDDTDMKLNFSYRIITKNGKLLNVENFAYYKSQGIVGGIIFDKTEKIEIKKALLQSETKYSSLFNYLNIGSALCEVITNGEDKVIDFIFLDVNPAYVEKPLKLTTLRRSKVTTPSQSKMTMQAGVK